MTTMLIVDDEMDMRMLVRVVIEMVNHGLSIVGEAADGDEAIQVWRRPRRPAGPRRRDPRQPHAWAHGHRGGRADPRGAAGPDHRALQRVPRRRGARRRPRRSASPRCVSKEDLDSLPHVIQELTAA